MTWMKRWRLGKLGRSQALCILLGAPGAQLLGAHPGRGAQGQDGDWAHLTGEKGQEQGHQVREGWRRHRGENQAMER